MSRSCFLRLAAALLFCPPWLVAATAHAQAPRHAECVKANDEVTKYRLGKNRAGRLAAVNVQKAVAIARQFRSRCSSDGQFMLASGLAKTDLAKDVANVGLDERAQLFREGVADLEGVKTLVLAGRSDQYEVFNVLGLIYYETKRFEESLAVIEASAPVFAKMTLRSRRNTFFTRGLAQYQLGREADASRSFGYAKMFGHPEAAAWQARMKPASSTK
ncbi:MAG TPA: hypothetical protein VEA61_14575 [Allosphingosinicella sp.]|nr:hypothetical protein [Allosphingosinicella sp.]